MGLFNLLRRLLALSGNLSPSCQPIEIWMECGFLRSHLYMSSRTGQCSISLVTVTGLRTPSSFVIDPLGCIGCFYCSYIIRENYLKWTLLWHRKEGTSSQMAPFWSIQCFPPSQKERSAFARLKMQNRSLSLAHIVREDAEDFLAHDNLNFYTTCQVFVMNLDIPFL